MLGLTWCIEVNWILSGEMGEGDLRYIGKTTWLCCMGMVCLGYLR